MLSGDGVMEEAQLLIVNAEVKTGASSFPYAQEQG